jgi:NAD-dependent dihydropyrimidine dehydrogenase PreA subunit
MIGGIAMYIVNIDTDKCEGCGDCVEVCPVELLELVEEDGKKYDSFIGDANDCIGCMACEEECPDGAITVTEM